MVAAAESKPGDQEVFEPTYEMTESQARALCAEFLDSGDIGETDGDPSCYLIGPNSKYSNLGRYVEATAFFEKFQDEPEILKEQYGPYENTSNFFVIVKKDEQKPIGVMRLIEDSSAGLKSVVDLDKPLGITPEQIVDEYGIDFTKTVDIGTLALLKEYRGPKSDTPTLLAYRSLWRTVLTNPRFDHIVAVIDNDAKNRLDQYHFPFHKILGKGPFKYLGSNLSWPCYASTEEYRKEVPAWAARLSEEGAREEDQDKQLVGAVLHWLTDDHSGLDSSIGYPEPKQL